MLTYRCLTSCIDGLTVNRDSYCSNHYNLSFDHFSGNNCGDAGGKALGEMIAKNFTLEELDLSRSSLRLGGGALSLHYHHHHHRYHHHHHHHHHHCQITRRKGCDSRPSSESKSEGASSGNPKIQNKYYLTFTTVGVRDDVLQKRPAWALFVLLSTLVLSANRFDFGLFLFQQFSNFTPPPPRL